MAQKSLDIQHQVTFYITLYKTELVLYMTYKYLNIHNTYIIEIVSSSGNVSD